MKVGMSDVRTLATGLDHPEGIALGPDGLLYAGGEAGQVYRVDPATGDVEQIAKSEDGFMFGVCLDAEESIELCDAGRGAVLRVDPSGAVETWCAAAGGELFDAGAHPRRCDRCAVPDADERLLRRRRPRHTCHGVTWGPYAERCRSSRSRPRAALPLTHSTQASRASLLQADGGAQAAVSCALRRTSRPPEGQRLSGALSSRNVAPVDADSMRSEMSSRRTGQ